MKRRTLLLLHVHTALCLLAGIASAQGLPIKSGSSSDLAGVNANKAVETIGGISSRATYIVSVSNVAVTAAGSDVMSLEAEAARGFRIAKLCISPGVATAAANVQWQLIRTTTASSAGTVISAEATSGNNSLAKMDPADANWSGIARAANATEGVSGAILDSGNVHVTIAATPPSTVNAWQMCKEYGIAGEKMPTVLPGVTLGVKLMFEGTAGGTDLSAQIHFVAN